MSECHAASQYCARNKMMFREIYSFFTARNQAPLSSSFGQDKGMTTDFVMTPQVDVPFAKIDLRECGQKSEYAQASRQAWTIVRAASKHIGGSMSDEGGCQLYHRREVPIGIGSSQALDITQSSGLSKPEKIAHILNVLL